MTRSQDNHPGRHSAGSTRPSPSHLGLRPNRDASMRRERTPSLEKMALTWFAIVRTDVPRAIAMSRFVRPESTNSATARSASDRQSGNGAADSS